MKKMKCSISRKTTLYYENCCFVFQEITSIKLDPRELSPEDFSTPEISTVEAKEKDSSESSVAEKT